MKKTLILLFISSVLYTCDKVDSPYSESTTTTTNATTLKRKILIEDFTGQQCGNCPRAAEMITTLENLYPNQIVPVAMHTGFFAVPELTGAYSADFRTSTADDLLTFFNATNFPNGIVNRKQVNGNYALSHTAWATEVSTMVNTIPDFGIRIKATTQNGTITGSTTFYPQKNLNATYKYSVWITEDAIINWQKDYAHNPVDIPNYEHKHLLRSAINSTWGSDAYSASISPADSLTLPWSVGINPSWNITNCNAIVFVYDTATKEVVQVESIRIP